MKATPQTSPQRDAFTLVELLVVVAIIGIIAAMLFPSIKQVYKRAQAATCISNLKQLANAFSTYAADNDGYYPPAINNVMNNYLISSRPFSELTNSYIPSNSKVFFCPTMTNRQYGLKKTNAADWDRSSYYYYPLWTNSGNTVVEVKQRVGVGTNSVRVILSDLTRFGSSTIPTFHDGKGVTVAFSDGAVKFINTEPKEEWYNEIQISTSQTSLDLYDLDRLSRKFMRYR